MIYIGIDPGLTGAIAVLWAENQVADMPTTVAGKGVVKREVNGVLLADMLRPFCGTPGSVRVVLERTSAMPGQGVVSMFSMGVSRGVILGVLGALGVPFIDVAPQTWKAHFRLLGADKDASRTLALRRFPELAGYLARKGDHNRAEALLLAVYGLDTANKTW